MNESHFKNKKAIQLLKDVTEFEYTLLIRRLAEESGQQSAWYRLRELSEKVKEIFELVEDE